MKSLKNEKKETTPFQKRGVTQFTKCEQGMPMCFGGWMKVRILAQFSKIKSFINLHFRPSILTL
jgi:hypothetical protein